MVFWAGYGEPLFVPWGFALHGMDTTAYPAFGDHFPLSVMPVGFVENACTRYEK